MKRLLSVFVFGLLLLPNAVAQYTIENIAAMLYSELAGERGFPDILWGWDILRGDIKSIREVFYDEDELRFYQIKRYGKNQKLLEELTYNRKDTTKLDRQSLCTYNDRGELILEKYVSFRYNEPDTTYAHVLYTYNDKGIVIRKEFFSNDDSLPHSIEEYNEQGFPTYYMQGRDDENFFTYDENNRLSKIKEEGGDKPRHHILEHDAKGRLISVSSYEANSSPYTFQSFKYNRKGRIVKKNYNQYADNTTIYSGYELLVWYDKKDRIVKVKKIVIEHNKKESYVWIYYAYDSQGNMIEMRSLKNNRPEEVDVVKYTYDEFGNSISRFRTNNKMFSYIFRLIEYY